MSFEKILLNFIKKSCRKVFLSFLSFVFLYNFYNLGYLFPLFSIQKIQKGTKNSDRNFKVVILHFSQWGRNLRDFPPTETNFGLIFPAWRRSQRVCDAEVFYSNTGRFKSVNENKLLHADRRENGTKLKIIKKCPWLIFILITNLLFTWVWAYFLAWVVIA